MDAKSQDKRFHIGGYKEESVMFVGMQSSVYDLSFESQAFSVSQTNHQPSRVSQSVITTNRFVLSIAVV